MADKLVQQNFNEIIIDDGSVKVPIRNKHGEQIGEFSFRPTDIGIVDRFNSVAAEFDKIVEPLESVNIKPDGTVDEQKPPPRVMDWEQDESIMFPAVNKVAGFEVRSARYVHWWTFMGYYMEISDGVFAQVLNLRLKRAKGKKLEKWEREYWISNRAICALRTKLSEEEQAEKDRIDALLG